MNGRDRSNGLSRVNFRGRSPTNTSVSGTVETMGSCTNSTIAPALN